MLQNNFHNKIAIFQDFQQQMRLFPNDIVTPGQGLNTGVLLLDLEKMRNSSEFNQFTTQVLQNIFPLNLEFWLK